MKKNLDKVFKYSLIKIALMPISIWIISSLVFLLLRVAPGGPCDAMLGTSADQIARDNCREDYGLNDPFINQYLNYLSDLIHLNLGNSTSNGEPVIDVISRALPASIELGFFAIIFAALIGFPLGYLGLKKKGSKYDYFSRITGISSYAIPPFWGAMMAQLIFSVILRIFPIGGRFPIFYQAPNITGFIILDSILNSNLFALQAAIYHLLLPSITLGFLLSGIFSRSFRMNLDKSLRSDYYDAAVCRGINNKNLMINYAIPNALLPILTITGLTIASLAGGALLIEITFSWPGIALKLQEAIFQRDYKMVQGITIVISLLIVSINLFIDILIAFIDPRIDY